MVLVILLVVIGVPALTLGLATLAGPMLANRPAPPPRGASRDGLPPGIPAWIRCSVDHYLYVLGLLAIDAVLVLLIPWVWALRDLGKRYSTAEVVLVLALTGAALVHLWRHTATPVDR